MNFQTRVNCEIEIQIQNSPTMRLRFSQIHSQYLTLWESLSSHEEIWRCVTNPQIELVGVSQSGNTEFVDTGDSTVIWRNYKIGMNYVARSLSGLPAPTFSVVVRTTGHRMRSLERALICLAQQSFRNFEVVVVVSTLDRAIFKNISDEVRSNQLYGQMNLRLLHSESVGRTGPLNAGLLCALGERVTFLDDDDYVLANWLENFASGASLSRGNEVLRQGVVSVRDSSENSQNNCEIPFGHSLQLTTEYCRDWSFIRSCSENQTPIHGWSCVNPKNATSGLFFDDAFQASEDWNYLMRASARDGMLDLGEIGAIYNISAGESRKIETQSSWKSAFEINRSVLNSASVTLPPGWLDEVTGGHSEFADCAEDFQPLQSELERIRREVVEVEAARYQTERELRKFLRRSPIFFLSHPVKWISLFKST